MADQNGRHRNKTRVGTLQITSNIEKLNMKIYGSTAELLFDQCRFLGHRLESPEV